MPSGITGTTLPPNTLTTIFTSSPLAKISSSNIYLCNKSTGVAKVRLAISMSETPAIGEYLEYDFALSKGTTLERSCVHVPAGHKIFAMADVAGVDATVDVVEIQNSTVTASFSATDIQSSSPALVYDAPDGIETSTASIFVCNRNSYAIQVSISVSGNNSHGNYLDMARIVPPNDSYERLGLILSSGDNIVLSAQSGTSVSVIALTT